jgi:hypothetical protein
MQTMEGKIAVVMRAVCHMLCCATLQVAGHQGLLGSSRAHTAGRK